MIEYVLICAIVSICIYVFAVYSNSHQYMNATTYVEGMAKHKKPAIHITKAKHSAPIRATPQLTQPSQQPTTEVTNAQVNYNRNIVPPSGVGATAPIYIQNITARKVAFGEELNVPAYGSDYMSVLENMTELMYRKSLNSCLQYTDDMQDEVLHDMNLYMSTIDTLKKLAIWVNTNYEDPENTPGNLYGVEKTVDGWFR